jgi:hypothetical protein
MIEINLFKVLLLYKIMWPICCTDADVDTLHVKRIGLNNP